MRFWTWLTVAQAGLLAVALAQYYYDLFGVLADLDQTYITFAITGIAAFTSLTLYRQKINEWHWFVSDAVLSLGMVGTLFGFLMVLGQSLADIDTASTESMTQAISLLASGMSTALVTSLVGLIASLWLKLQMVIIEGE